jgi:hypothetical protein
MNNRIYPFEGKFRLSAIQDSSYSVEIKLNGFLIVYLSKLRTLNGDGPCFIVKQNSIMMKRLRVGLGLELRCWSPKNAYAAKYFKAKTKHITLQHDGPFRGHYLVGLTIEAEKGFDSEREMEGLLARIPKAQNEGEARSGTERRQVSLPGNPNFRNRLDERRSGVDRRSGRERRKIISLQNRELRS